MTEVGFLTKGLLNNAHRSDELPSVYRLLRKTSVLATILADSQRLLSCRGEQLLLFDAVTSFPCRCFAFTQQHGPRSTDCFRHAQKCINAYRVSDCALALLEAAAALTY
jgi:hypothetical protein